MRGARVKAPCSSCVCAVYCSHEGSGHSASHHSGSRCPPCGRGPPGNCSRAFRVVSSQAERSLQARVRWRARWRWGRAPCRSRPCPSRIWPSSVRVTEGTSGSRARMGTRYAHADAGSAWRASSVTASSIAKAPVLVVAARPAVPQRENQIEAPAGTCFERLATVRRPLLCSPSKTTRTTPARS